MNNGKIILVTGGSRSGKSKFAEELLKDESEVMYIATAIITDKEMEGRIEKHIQRRDKNWRTFEGYKNLDSALQQHEEPNILLDCVTIMITNIMFDKQRDFDNITIEETEMLLYEIKKEFEKLLFKARETNRKLVLVTNEVGYGIVPEYKLSRIFRDIAGSINQYIAELSDEVYLVVCGLPMKIK